jgi:hypothetical protein
VSFPDVGWLIYELLDHFIFFGIRLIVDSRFPLENLTHLYWPSPLLVADPLFDEDDSSVAPTGFFVPQSDLKLSSQPTDAL